MRSPATPSAASDEPKISDPWANSSTGAGTTTNVVTSTWLLPEAGSGSGPVANRLLPTNGGAEGNRSTSTVTVAWAPAASGPSAHSIGVPFAQTGGVAERNCDSPSRWNAVTPGESEGPRLVTVAVYDS